MASAFDMFKTAPQTPQPSPNNQSNPGQLPTVPTQTTTYSPNTAPNGTVPTPNIVNDKPKNPLDEFKTVWDTPKDKDGKEIPPISTEVFPSIDPKQLMEAAGKVDFSKVIKPEQLEAVKAGGEGAAKALAEIINASSQQVYAQSAYATTEIVKEAVKKIIESQDKALAEKLRGLNLSESLQKENPVFSHPAATPILEGIQNQLALKNPNASTEELKQLAKGFLEAFASSFAPKQEETSKGNKGSKETDWSKFLE